MRIAYIIWLDDFVDKLRRKHAVEPEEVEEVLTSGPYFFFAEKGHREGENVYGAFGQSDAGRYLVIYFIYKADTSALILSARDMARKDRRRYERR
ncbi:MAG: BrnT family toxin [bacterium]|nr:BrnT family toxin [bacterium]